MKNYCSRILTYVVFALTVQFTAGAFAESLGPTSRITAVGSSSFSFATDSGWVIAWGDYEWKDNGDDTVTLYPVDASGWLNPEHIQSRYLIRGEFTIIVRNKKGEKTYEKTFRDMTYARYFAMQLASLRLKYDEDSLQVIVSKKNNGSAWHLSILGYIQNNLSIRSFSAPSFETLEKNALVPTRTGLKAIYLNQDRVEDGHYYIETTPLNGVTQYLAVNSNDNVISSPEKQEWILEFDDNIKTYRIKHATHHKSLARHGEGKRNVFVYFNGEYSDQSWYFNKTQSGEYEITSAAEYSYFLNLDADAKNISVAEQRNNSNQYFKLVRVN